jgi:hypothetical protein
MLREAARGVPSVIKGLVLFVALAAPCAEASHQPPLSIAPRASALRPHQAQPRRSPRTFLGKLAQGRSLLTVSARPSENTDVPLFLTVGYPLPFRGPPPAFATYVTRVRYDLFLFQAIPVDLNPLLRTERSLTPSPKIRFWSAPPTDDLLAIYRQRDRLLYFRDMPLSGAHLAMGFGVFAAAALLSAHAPRPLRILFDHSFHLGPAIFDRSGMGIGFGGRFR